MTAQNDPESSERPSPRTSLNYENAYAVNPQRTNEEITSDFSKAVLLSSVIAVAIAMGVWGDVPDPPIAAVCVLIGVPLFAVICGSIPLFVLLATRRSLLKTMARVQGRWMAYLSGVAYVAQIAAMIFVVNVTGLSGSRSSLWPFVPLVPVLSPFWLVRRAQ